MKNSLNFVFVIILILYLLHSFYNISVTFINFPIRDDYEAFFDFTYNFLKSNTVSEKLRLVFSQHNEHRIATLRILDLAYFYLFDNINLKYFRLFGLVYLIFALYFLFRLGEFSSKKIVYFIPVPLLLVSYNYSEIFLLAMESVTHLAVITSSIATIYFLVNKKNIFGAIFFLFWCTFSNGNGLLLIPLGFIPLLFLKDYKNLFYWTLSSIILLAVYFTNYKGGKLAISVYSFQYILKTLPIYVGGIGGATSLKINLILGIFAIGFTIYLITAKKIFKKELGLTLLLSFFFITYLLICIKRIDRGTDFLFREVYRINSIMIFVILYIIFYKTHLLYWLKEKKHKLIYFSSSIIVLFTIAYQYKNYSTWIHIFESDQNQTKQELIRFVGNCTSIYLDNGNIYNTLLVSKKSINNLVKEDAFDLDKVAKKIIAKPITYENNLEQTISDIKFEFEEINGQHIAQNKFITILGKATSDANISHLDFGYFLEAKDHKIFFKIPKEHKRIFLIKNKNNHEQRFGALIEKKYLKDSNYNVSVFYNTKNKIYKSPPIHNIVLHQKHNFKENYSTPIDLGKEFAYTVSSKTIPLIEAFEDDNSHKIRLDLNELSLDKNSENYLGFEKNNNIKFILKLEINNIEKEGYLTFNKKAVEKYIVDYYNIFKLVYIKKNGNSFIKYPTNSIYFFNTSK